MAFDRLRNISDEIADLKVHLKDYPANAWKIDALVRERKKIVEQFIVRII